MYLSADAKGNLKSLEAGVTGRCEPPNLGAGYQTPALFKSSKCF